MKNAILFSVILVLTLFPNSVASQIKQDAKIKQPVLVELFTSQGCSTCPQAENALEILRTEQPYANAEIITLAFHVDYYDRLGWKDDFSTKFFTQRQENYAFALKSYEIYTPQMVIDGRNEFTGSNLAKISLGMNAASKNEKGKIELNLENETNLKVKISELPNHKDSSVNVAIAEDNISYYAKRGDNNDRKFEHSSVVRELKSIESVTSEQKSLEIETQLQFDAKWKRNNIRIVVFVQENVSRKVIAVGQTKIIR